MNIIFKSGTTNLKISIEKDNLLDENWSAHFDGDLYNNNVEIDQVLYNKKEKKKATLKLVILKVKILK